MVYMPLSAFPGKPLGPAYVLIMRLAGGARLYQGGLSSANDFLQISPAMYDSAGRTFRFGYTVNIDDRGQIIRGKPPVEAFAAGLLAAPNPSVVAPAPSDGGQHGVIEKATRYDPETGRVFLLDLTTDPPSVKQVRCDLNGALPHPNQNPSLEDMRAGVAKLAASDKAVREFLDKVGKR